VFALRGKEVEEVFDVLMICSEEARKWKAIQVDQIKINCPDMETVSAIHAMYLS